MNVQLKSFQDEPERMRPRRHKDKIPGYIGQINFGYGRTFAAITYFEHKMNRAAEKESSRVWETIYQTFLKDPTVLAAFCKGWPESYVPALKCFVCKIETAGYEYFLSIPEQFADETIIFVIYDKKNLETDSRKRLRHRLLALD